MEYSVVLILELLFLGAAEAVDWCQERCGSRMEHVRCAFKERTNNSLCPEIRSLMTSGDKELILHYHNVFRNQVAKGSKKWKAGETYVRGWDSSYKSGAGDMRQLVWDPELEENARIYASQCDVKAHMPYACAHTENVRPVHMSKFDHSKSHLSLNNTINKFVYGKKFIHLYSKESSLISAYVTGPWKDFFAVIFSQTYRLGCSRMICRCNQIQPLYETGSVVCIYGPAPNFSDPLGGFRIFARGRACKYCPEDTRCRSRSEYKYLCARDGDPLGPNGCPTKQSLLHFLLVKFLMDVAY